MHITNLKVQGFKSFDSATSFPLHPHLNVIVGRNGSGKSNLFAALNLIFQPKSMSPRERSGLLHQTSSHRAQTASIEVTIDNSDDRIPNQKDQIVIRREFGATKSDSFLINGTTASRNELLQMLEVAGFSRQNPYNIVKQGSIASLATSGPAHLLSVVKDLAGVSVWDERRDKAVIRLKNCEKDLAEMDERLADLAKDLTELQDEQKDLKKVNTLDRHRRALEHVLQSREVDRAREKLAALNVEYEAANSEVSKKGREIAHLGALKSAIESQLKIIRGKELEARQGLEEVAAEKVGLTEVTVKLQSKLDLKRDEVAQVQAEERSNLKNMKAIQKEVEEKEVELQEATKTLREAQEIYDDLEAERAKKNKLISFSTGQKGQQQLFRDEEERLQWLSNEMEEVSSLVSAQTNAYEVTKDHLQAIQADKSEKEVELVAIKLQLREMAAEKEQLEAKATTAQNDHAEILAEKQAALRKKMTASQKLQASADTLDRVRTEIRKKSSHHRELLAGLESVQRVITEESEDSAIAKGYIGIVADLFNSEEALDLAISVSLGSKLFNVVVESAEVANKIIAVIKRKNLPGIVNYMPIDKLRPKEFGPLPGVKNCKKMRDLVKAAQEFDGSEVLFKFLFGGHVLVENAGVAAKLRGQGVNCVTVDGQQFFNRGDLKGGYYDPRGALLTQLRKLMENWQAKYELEELVQRLTTAVDRLSARCAGPLEARQKFFNEAERLGAKIAEVKSKTTVIEAAIREAEGISEQADENLRRQRRHLDELTISLACLQGGDDSGLPNQSQEMTDLISRMDMLKGECKEAYKARNAAEKERNRIRLELDFDCKKRLRELEDEMASQKSVGALKNEYLELQTRLEVAINELNEVSERHTKLGKVLSNFAAEDTLRKKQEELDQISEELATIQTSFDVALKVKSSYESRKATLEAQTVQKANQQTLPGKEIEAYQSKTDAECFRALKKAQRQIANYPDVNPLAAELFRELSGESEKFAERRETLAHEHSIVIKLLEAIEVNRREKTHFTFAQVSNNFKVIFKELVPKGKGRMKFVLANDAQESQGDGGAGAMANDPEPVGIELKVKFRGREEMNSLEQLSGGQKSVVSIALILAMQKTDPAPFYVMDEIDAALDKEHRARVIRWVAKQNCQVIATTFRREFLARADHFVGVKFGNASSRADVVSAEAALDFVEDNPQEEDLSGAEDISEREA